MRELKTKCPGCAKIMAIGDLDAHVKSCLKPKCSALDCDVSEEEMKEVVKVNSYYNL